MRLSQLRLHVTTSLYANKYGYEMQNLFPLLDKQPAETSNNGHSNSQQNSEMQNLVLLLEKQPAETSNNGHSNSQQKLVINYFKKV